MLQEEIAHAIRAAVLDGEIVCLAADGRSKFYDLMFRREWPHFIAFDVHSIEGEDLQARPLSSGSAGCAASCRGSTHGFCITTTSTAAVPSCSTQCAAERVRLHRLLDGLHLLMRRLDLRSRVHDVRVDRVEPGERHVELALDGEQIQ